MQTINKLLDSAAKACNAPSDRQLAKKLGVSPSAVSLWRKGDPIKDGHLIEVIELAQADPALLVLVRQETAAAKSEKKAWGALWDRLSPVTTVIGVVSLAVGAGMLLQAPETLATAMLIPAWDVHYEKLGIAVTAALVALYCHHRSRSDEPTPVLA
jgi:hypothetical protein